MPATCGPGCGSWCRSRWRRRSPRWTSCPRRSSNVASVRLRRRAGHRGVGGGAADGPPSAMRGAAVELAAVLRLVDAGKVAVSDKTRRPTGAAVRLMAGVLEPATSSGDEEDEVGPIRAFAWPMLVQAAGWRSRWLSPAADGSGSQGAGRSRSRPASGALAAVADARLLDELNRVNAIKGQAGKGQAWPDCRRRTSPDRGGRASDCPRRAVGRRSMSCSGTCARADAIRGHARRVERSTSVRPVTAASATTGLRELAGPSGAVRTVRAVRVCGDARGDRRRVRAAGRCEDDFAACGAPTTSST